VLAHGPSSPRARDDDVRTVVRLSPKILIPAALALAALIGGALVYVEADKTILLSVDGEAREVQTFAGSVSGLLEQEGIEVDSKDTVAPDLSTELTEGQRVAVRNGRLVSVTVDGQQREVWTTATTVDEALITLGYRGDRVYASASRSKRIPLDGLTLEVRTPKTVTIVADGASRTVVSTMGTVETLLGQYDVTLSPTDEVSVPLTTRPTNNMVVTVVRVVTAEELVERPVPFGKEQRPDASMTVGSSKVLQAGVNGSVVDVYSVTRRDGVEVARTLVETRPGAAAVNQITAVGTKPRAVAPRAAAPAPTGAAPVSSGGLNWAALARCESGGNPRAYNPAGPYYGLYQFSLGTWRSVGGSGLPSEASADEQTYRAQLLYNSRGRSPWPHCGRYL
jgi:uncharacterized protein YabE (DUF348 family)